MRLFDRLFRRVAPSPHSARALEGASGARFHRVPPAGALGREVAAGAAIVRARARHLAANDATASNAVALWRTALIGYGPTATCATPGLADSFQAWADRTRFAALLDEIAAALVVDGEAFVVMSVDAEGALRLRHIPAEQIDESLTAQLPDGRYVVGGVEFTADDEVAAFHIRRSRAADLFPDVSPPVRVPAEDTLHFFRRDAAGQHRGLSWLAPVIIAMNEHAQLFDAAIVNTKIASMMAGFVKDDLSSGTAFGDAEGFDPASLSLEPGTIRRLPAGTSISFTPPQTMAQANELIATSLRAIAAGLHLPEFALSGDMSRVNYSSARTALVQFRQIVEARQWAIFAPQLDRIFARWLALSDHEMSSDAKPQWLFPKQPWVDPAKDVRATIDAINAGLMSRRQAVAELGFSLEKIDAEIASDKLRANASKPKAQPQNGVA